MKNTIKIIGIIYLSLLFSCTFTENRRIHYLHIQNNTNYDVVMNIVENDNETINLKEYYIPAHQKIFADTVIYRGTSNEGEGLSIEKGEGYIEHPYWHPHSTSNKYTFEDVKMTKLLTNPGSDECDTSHQYNYTCNFREYENIGPIEINHNFYEYTETVTYHITQQQYNNADSL